MPLKAGAHPQAPRFPRPPAIALVLSGGGVQGDFEIGAVRYLYDHGIRPDIICGTSVGAINGGALFMGEGSLDLLESVWLELKVNEDMYKMEPWFQNLDPGIRTLLTGELVNTSTPLSID